MTLARCQRFEQNAKFKHGECTVMSNTAWCYLNSKGDLMKLHHKYPKNKCSCQKMINFNPSQFETERSGLKSKSQTIFKGFQTARNEFLKPAVRAAGPFIEKAVGAKNEKPQVAQATTNILKSISGGNVPSLTDVYGKDFI